MPGRAVLVQAATDCGGRFRELLRVQSGSGRNLDVAEEDYIRAGGGPRSTGGSLENRRHQMSERRYRRAGGTIPYQ